MDEHVPLPIVSKTLRQSTFSTTVDVYHYLTSQAVREAVDAINHTLDQADHNALHGDHATRIPRAPRLTTQQARENDTASPTSAPANPSGPHCDHQPTNIKKAASTYRWKRPTTCENAGRDDRI
ncbi:hypothetical protein AB0K43_12970 [Kitasatospora sp. NPDC049258]|uniref:hypothetical protein n=1 Tax=Kitasatospora sp. NPDC049258 TaxID=3155394 RepID=UPI00342BEB46